MPLEPAGVDLQAKNFQQYIRNLVAIEKQQQKAFDDSGLKKLGISYNKAVSEAKKFERQTQRNAKAQSALSSNIKGLALALFTQQTAEAVIESAKMAASFDSQQKALNKLAAQYSQSGTAITQSIVSASNNTVSASQALLAANQGLLLGVARTPAEFEKVTRSAVVLGRTLGLEAPDAIEQLTTALGRKSLEILDNFGISAKQVNAEIDRLAQDRLQQTGASLNAAQRDALFLEAALNVASEAAAVIDQESLKASENFDRLVAEAENLQVAFGAAVLPAVSGLSGLLADAAVTAQQLLAFISAGAAGLGSVVSQVAGNIKENFQDVFDDPSLKNLFGLEGQSDRIKNLFDVDLQKASQAAVDSFKDVARVADDVTFPEGQVESSTQAIKENTEEIKENEAQLKSLESTVRQAEQLQLSFARAAEDAARKLGKDQAKLAQSQAKDRDKLLIDQQKQLEDFESNRLKSIASAEKEIAQSRVESGRNRLREQQNIQRQLKQAADRFNLDRIQSERRFLINDKRLRAEGDILALQQLREDHELQKQENKENFNLQQDQTKENTQAQLKEAEEETKQREAELQQRLADLKVNLENERAELLTGFDQQFAELQIAQQEQRAALLESYAEQQEDARINQQRQLEDLGRSLAEEQAVTAEGAQKIADELEKVFGQEGVADAIFGGFSDRTESEFRDLFNKVDEIVNTGIKPSRSGVSQDMRDQIAQLSGLSGSGLPSFDDGGIVPGPTGSPQLIKAHGGETVLPTHKMSIPAIPSQNLNVNMSGSFGVTGADNASSGVVDAAVKEMTDSLEIAIKRIARRN